MLVASLRALQLLLLGGCSYLLFVTVSPLVRATPVPRAELPPVARAPGPEASVASYEVIGERNLFKTREEAVPLEEVLEESRLALRLLGTVTATPPQLSVASVEDLTKGDRHSLRIGNWVAGAKLVRVERRRIVIENAGVLETLTIDENAPRHAGSGSAGRRGDGARGSGARGSGTRGTAATPSRTRAEARPTRSDTARRRSGARGSSRPSRQGGGGGSVAAVRSPARSTPEPAAPTPSRSDRTRRRISGHQALVEGLVPEEFINFLEDESP